LALNYYYYYYYSDEIKEISRIGNKARIGKMRMCTKLELESLMGRDHSEELGVDGIIILKRILGK
jgi:hypothetical protein